MTAHVCPFCQHPAPAEQLAEVNWLSSEMLADLAMQHPGWQSADGALEAGLAVSLALREQHESLAACTSLPYITRQRIEFVLHEHHAQEVRVSGSWHGWDGPGLALAQAEPGVWRGDIPRLPPGEYSYKFLVDGRRWLDDPANPDKRWDGRAGFDSVLSVPLQRN